MGQPGQHVFEVSVGIDVAPPAAFDEGVDDGASLTGSGFSDKEPVLFSHGGGPNGVFDQVVVDLQTAIFQKEREGGPLAQSIIDGLAHQALRQMPSTGFETQEGALQTLDD